MRQISFYLLVIVVHTFICSLGLPRDATAGEVDATAAIAKLGTEEVSEAWSQILEELRIQSEEGVQPRGETGYPSIVIHNYRSKLLSGDIADGYGALILRRNGKNNLKACESFFMHGNYKSIKELLANNLRRNGRVAYRPTFWLDSQGPKEISSAESKRTDPSALCSILMPRYDYAAADALSAKFRIGAGPGPFLAMWRAKSLDYLIFDLSAVGRPETLLKMFAAWQQKISQDIDLWEIGTVTPISLKDRIRELIANQADAVGLVIKDGRQLRGRQKG